MRIVIKDICKKYDNKEVLKNVSFELQSGNWLSIIGISGSGKSTVLNLISGLINEDNGQIIIDNYKDQIRRRELVGYLQQDFPLYPSLTAKGNLKFAENRRFNNNGPRFDEIVEILKLGCFLDKLPSMLSGGEKQRLALGRTLLLNRPVLLLDEPFSNIDVVMKRYLRRYCRSLQKRLEITAVLVTHDQEDAMSTSDFAAFLDEGKIIQLDRPEQIYRNPLSKNVGENIGDVGMNWISPKLFGININSHNETKSISGYRETDFEIYFSKQENYLEVEITDREYLGSRYRYFIKHKDQVFSIVSSKNINKEIKMVWIYPTITKIDL